MMPEMEMVKDAALKYDKPTLARMAQMGQISPTIAVMAGMMRDRIVQSEMKPPEQTVAEEVMQPMNQQMGLGAIAPQGIKQAQGQGLDQIPVPDQMFSAPQGMAGGGIVAFQNTGFVRDGRLLAMMNGMERAEYERTGKIPDRLQKFVPKTDVESRRFARQDSGVPMSSEGIGLGSFLVSPPPPPPPSGRDNLPSTTQTATQLAAAQPELGIEQQFAQDYAIMQRVLGEDPTRAKLKELYEKQEKASEEDVRKDQAMRLIEAGLGIAGGTSPYFAANLAGAIPALKGYGEDIRARRKEATERAKGMAELEGMTRKEKAEVLGRTMAERREDKKTQEAYKNQEKLARLQASLKRDAEDVLLDPRSTQEEKQRAREVLSLKRSLGSSSSSMPKLSFEDAMKAAESQYGFQWQKMSPEDKARAADIIYRKYNAGTGTWGEMTVSGGK